MPLVGIPLVSHAVRGILKAQDVAHVVVVAPSADRQRVAAAVEPMVAPHTARVGLSVVTGGAERSDSVAAGVAALPDDVGIVLVHDAARALAPPELFDEVVRAVRDGHPAVVPGLPVADTIKTVTADGHVDRTLDRSSLRAVQTPQGFLRETLQHAHASATAGSGATDDAGMVEAAGGHVSVVPGHPDAMKITTPDDLARAAELLSRRGGPVLVVVGGRPGVGKTTVARRLVEGTGWVHLRLDTVEQAMLAAGAGDVGAQGYAVLYALAREQLAARRTVVADAVGWVPRIRDAWREVAADAGVALVEVELGLADEVEHRRRVESRVADLPGHALPTWEAASDPAYQAWSGADVLRLDTADLDLREVVDRIMVRVLDEREGRG